MFHLRWEKFQTCSFSRQLRTQQAIPRKIIFKRNFVIFLFFIISEYMAISLFELIKLRPYLHESKPLKGTRVLWCNQAKRILNQKLQLFL